MAAPSRTLRLRAESMVDMAQAAGLLRRGDLVAFATETVYGLGANALSERAVAGIFAAKERPSWDPLIVHVHAPDQIQQIADVPLALQSRFDRLAQLWPGPLTLLLPRRAVICDAVTAGRALVGVRVPAHPTARRLIELAGVPVAAPSANRFGHTSPTTAQHVLDDLDGRIEAVLDAGPCSVGVESTVVDPSTTPMTVYRPGGITLEALQQATGVSAALFLPPVQDVVPEALPSPGVGIRHYAPRATLHLIDLPAPKLWSDRLTEAITERTAQAQTLGVMLPAGLPPAPIPRDALLEPWGEWSRPETLAAGLFASLRNLDERGVTAILCPLPPPGGLRDALRDRLLKAARTT